MSKIIGAPPGYIGYGEGERAPRQTIFTDTERLSNTLMNGGFTGKIIWKDFVTSKLCYWPEFCDAKFLEFKFSRNSEFGASLSMLLHYIDTDKGLDLNVKIVLVEVTDMEFHGLMIENVIDHIGLTDLGDDGVEFEIEAAAGLYGSCSCESAKVELASLKTYSPEL